MRLIASFLQTKINQITYFLNNIHKSGRVGAPQCSVDPTADKMSQAMNARCIGWFLQLASTAQHHWCHKDLFTTQLRAKWLLS